MITYGPCSEYLSCVMPQYFPSILVTSHIINLSSQDRGQNIYIQDPLAVLDAGMRLRFFQSFEPT